MPITEMDLAEQKLLESNQLSPKHEIQEQMTTHEPIDSTESNTIVKDEDKDESEHIDVGSELKLETEMVDVVTTDKKVTVKPDLDAIIVESGKIHICLCTQNVVSSQINENVFE